MTTLQSILRIWRAMLSASNQQHLDGDTIISTKVHPEGYIYLSSHVPMQGTPFRGNPRLVLSHAEHDLSVHLFKCIMGRIDWARQVSRSEDSGLRLESKWILGVYELHELFLDTMELELSRKSVEIPQW